MKILLTGGSGRVGSQLRKFLDVYAPTHEELDITKPKLEFKPDVIIHAAAYTGGDKDKCFKVNVLGTRNIDNFARKIGAFHIFISSGSVLAPKSSYYAWSKAKAEKEVHGAIIRISHPLYIGKLLTLDTFYDNVRFPLTAISDLARAIKKIIKLRRRGTYHVASPDLVSPYELMSTIKKVKATQTTKEFPAISVSKTQKILGIHFKSWKEVATELPIFLGDKR